MRPWPLTVVLALVLSVPAQGSDDAPSAALSARRLLAIADAILENHIAPPTRQEMVLGALRELYFRGNHAAPIDLSRKVSDAPTEAALQLLIEECIADVLSQGTLVEDLDETLQNGLLASSPGELSVRSANTARVDEQFRSNRYVGIGITLAASDGVPVMQGVIPGGPASVAGVQDGTRILAIEGESTQDVSLERIVELLRGDEGSAVNVTLQSPNSNVPYELAITRGVVPLQTVSGYQLYPGGNSAQIAYLRIDRLSASSVHELEQHVDDLENSGAAGLLLDLRTSEAGTVHDAVLLADALLDGGPIGRVITRRGSRDYTAQPDALFPELKLGVLVGRGTRGPVEWLAAALQANQRAVVFGELTSGNAFDSEFVPLLDGTEVLRLPTAILEAPHGVRLLKLPTDESHFGSLAMGLDPDESRAMRPPWGVLGDVSLPMSTGVGFSEAPMKAAEELMTFNPASRNALRRGGPSPIRRNPNVPSPGESDE